MLITLLLLATAQAGLPTCNNTINLRAASATFTDGSAATKAYASNLDECWVIRPKLARGEVVDLAFKRVDVEERYDWVHVYPLADKGAKPELADDDSTYTSSTGFVVHFHSDHEVEETGFTALYEARNAKVETVPDAFEDKVESKRER